LSCASPSVLLVDSCSADGSVSWSGNSPRPRVRLRRVNGPSVQPRRTVEATHEGQQPGASLILLITVRTMSHLNSSRVASNTIATARTTRPTGLVKKVVIRGDPFASLLVGSAWASPPGKGLLAGSQWKKIKC
jgi:hypothetical protein